MALPSHDEKRLNLALVLYIAQKPEKNLAGFVKEYVQFSGGGDAAEGEAMFELSRNLLKDAVSFDLDQRPHRNTDTAPSFTDRLREKYPFLTSKLLNKLYGEACGENWREG